ncbi:hypothetical protein KC354_g166 [Hortaea werneckii]|nr:hypothetical protein KC354_g166 [Hortaea werneckii]
MALRDCPFVVALDFRNLVLHLAELQPPAVEAALPRLDTVRESDLTKPLVQAPGDLPLDAWRKPLTVPATQVENDIALRVAELWPCRSGDVVVGALETGASLSTSGREREATTMLSPSSSAQRYKLGNVCLRYSTESVIQIRSCMSEMLNVLYAFAKSSGVSLRLHVVSGRGLQEDICKNLATARFPDDSVARCRFGKYLIAFSGTIGRQLTRCAEKVNRSLVSVYSDVSDKKTGSANRNGSLGYIDATQCLAQKIQQSLRTKAAMFQVFAPYMCVRLDSNIGVQDEAGDLGRVETTSKRGNSKQDASHAEPRQYILCITPIFQRLYFPCPPVYGYIAGWHFTEHWKQHFFTMRERMGMSKPCLGRLNSGNHLSGTVKCVCFGCKSRVPPDPEHLTVLHLTNLEGTLNQQHLQPYLPLS